MILRKNGRWKKVCAVILSLAMGVTMLPMNAMASSSSDLGNQTFSNPVIYADVPDIDMIRVGDAYYMVSTTMHLSPGCPIMKSTDLVNWEIVNYVYDILDTSDETSLRNGKEMYGNGQWASSLQYHDGTYYVAFNSNTTGTGYIYKTDDIENGSWEKTTLNGSYHDMALFFDDDNDAVYLVYGNTKISYVELESDLSGVKADGKKGDLFTGNGDLYDGYILNCEGTHVMKKDGYYYVFNICWPNGKPRTEVCHRSKTFPSTDWEVKTILSTNFTNNGVSSGVAQGGLIDTPDGKWYGFMFQDHGAIGRTPVLTDCTWVDGWPMLGKNGDGQTVEATMTIPVTGSDVKSIVKSDEFYNDAEHRVFSAEKKASEKTASEALSAAGTEVLVNNTETFADEGTPERTDADIIELIENGDFETGDTTGWEIMRTETADIEVVSDEKANGTYSAHVYNRASCGAGACQNISGKLVMGKTYTISGKLKYTSGPATKKFYVTIENGDNYNWRENLVTIDAKKDEWVSFSDTYTVHDKSDQYPFDNTQNYIFVETPWAQTPGEDDLMEYWLDDFSVTTESDNMIKNGSFEDGTTGWTGFEGATIEASTDEAQDGTTSVLTKNRTVTGQGPSQDLSNKLKNGNKYTITAYIKYNEGVDQKTFNVTIQNGPDWQYRTVMGSVTANKGEWTKLEVDYTMPDDAITDQNTIFFETLWAQTPTADYDLMDFYVDNVTMIEHPSVDKVLEEAGEYDYNGSDLDLVWQWNHNPNNNYWSLTERSGWLRLTTGQKATGLLDARNTLTQRTYGPTCSGKIKMDISNMKVGDVAGLGALSYNYSYIAAKKAADGTKLVMVDATGNSAQKKDNPTEVASVDCTSDTVYLKADFDFAGGDKIAYYYSFDGNTWSKLGTTVNPAYELTHFMGSKFAIFNYATKSLGGYVDYDYFRVSDDIIGETTIASDLSAEMSDVDTLSGVINSECEVKLTMDALESDGHTKLNASIAIPSEMSVTDVVFNKAAINGNAAYSYKNNRLTITVTGNDVAFNAADKVFATIKLKMNGYVDKDKTVAVTADYITVDGKMDYDVTNCKGEINLKYLDTKALAKKLGYSNPIITQEFGADPYAIVYDGRVYVYMTADDFEYDADGNLIDNSFGYIKTLRVVSSDDMVNWTDHGEIKVAGEDGAAKWAAHSWAPAIAYKQIDGKDKFFLYFANDASGIGVLEADTPLGPWTDPIGKALLTRQTPGCAGVVWCFDPAVLVDDDGSAYIYFGGGVPTGEQNNPKTARVAKLGKDMISIEGEAQVIDAPAMYEDSGIFKYGDTYYYTYCSNFITPHADGYPGYGTICYMESKGPMGPFTYKGEIFLNPQVWFGVGGNNHHATFVFEDQTYFIYHAQTVAKALGEDGKYVKGYRSTHIDSIEFNSDGSIKPIKGTYEGISQLRTVNPYERIDAETIAWNAGIKTVECSETGKLLADYNRSITDIQKGDWTSVAQLDFGNKGADKFTVSAASKNGGKIEVRLDSPEGAVIGTVNVAATGSETTYKTFTCAVDNVKGNRNVFLVFDGSDEDNIMNVDYYQFTEKAAVVTPPQKPATNTPVSKDQTLAQYVNKSFSSKTLNYIVTQCKEADKTVVVTDAPNKKIKSVTIPATVVYNGMTFRVVGIKDNAFKNCKKLKKVVIGKNVETVGTKAFYGSKELSKVVFKGSAVKKIGKSAFGKIKKSAVFDVPNKQIKNYNKLLKKAKTKSYKVK